MSEERNLSREHSVSHELDGHSTPIEGCPLCDLERRDTRRLREKMGIGTQG